MYAANSLVVMYAKCRDIIGARTLFDRMNERTDVVSWNSIISAYSIDRRCLEAFKLFSDMQKAVVGANTYTFVAALQACENSSFKKPGMEIHAAILKPSPVLDAYVANALVAMYVRFKLDANLKLDEVSLISILAASGRLGYLLNGKEIHAYAMKNGLDSNLKIGDTLIDTMCSKCCCVAYVGLVEGVEVDAMMIGSTLLACGGLKCLSHAKEVHGYALKRGLSGLMLQNMIVDVKRDSGLEESMVNSLVDMYARCGSLENANKVFICTRSKSLVLWTTMISAYGMHGRGKAAVELFSKMKDQKLIPDHISFLALLHGCSPSGSIDEGKRLLETMKCKYHLEPWPEHCACLVDLLGRANCLEEACHFVKNMQIEPTAEKLLEWDPDSPGTFVLISNLFASSGRWKDAEGIRMRMKRSGLKKNPGCSWIEGKKRKFRCSSERLAIAYGLLSTPGGTPTGSALVVNSGDYVNMYLRIWLAQDSFGFTLIHQCCLCAALLMQDLYWAKMRYSQIIMREKGGNGVHLNTCKILPSHVQVIKACASGVNACIFQ
ncbi:hypothetical protein NC651_005197 [Populus alba x Populus x berolinensis]|nr:hypothetical protein NC651_005197 [Populus alba x Populus x berolinensis]